MQLANFLDAQAVRVGVTANGKRALLHQLASVAAQRLDLPAEQVQDSIAAREKLGSTGFGSGIAIPHGKIEGLASPYALVARLAEPIDYKAVDGQPVDIIFLLLSPVDAGPEHLKALAAVSRIARHTGTLEKLRGARSRDAFAAVLLEADERDAA